MRDEARAIAKAVAIPSSDTPTPHAGFDPRAEPIMLTAPVIEKSRYFSVRFMAARVPAVAAPTKTGHINADSYKGQHKKALKASKVPFFVTYSLRHCAPASR